MLGLHFLLLSRHALTVIMTSVIFTGDVICMWHRYRALDDDLKVAGSVPGYSLDNSFAHVSLFYQVAGTD